MKNLIIGIAGGSGSGKTTLALRLKERFGEDEVRLISHDSYYKRHDELPFEERCKLNYDHPDAFEVVDETGKTAAQLCEYIDAGMPVVFWATLDFTPVPEERDHWLLADGTDFAWKCHEHCLLLVGYDDEHYWFNDPWHNHGVCAQPKALVEDCHAAQGMFAVTLKRK